MINLFKDVPSVKEIELDPDVREKFHSQIGRRFAKWCVGDHEFVTFDSGLFELYFLGGVSDDVLGLVLNSYIEASLIKYNGFAAYSDDPMEIQQYACVVSSKFESSQTSILRADEVMLHCLFVLREPDTPTWFEAQLAKNKGRLELSKLGFPFHYFSRNRTRWFDVSG